MTPACICMSIEEGAAALAVPAGGIDKCNKEQYRLWFDTPGELSAWLACSPYAACVGDDVN